MEVLAYVAAALVIIALTNAVAPKVGVAAPLLLVLIGIGASFIPALTGFELDPEWILAGLLPPLLYAAAVAMPSTDFRRELSTISALSIVLVVVSAVILGFFFTLVIPGLSLWWGIALGAVVSPTDAAATAIAKKAKLSGRLISILEGESLFNDATALVLLRTAIVAAAVTFSFWETLGQFLFSITSASVIGIVSGWLVLRLRSKATEAPVSTVLSFVTPFLASVPAEHIGASGLVAAVAAGLVTGHGSIRWLNAEQRMSDRQTWKPIEIVLEGAIFLLMGLQVTSLVDQVISDHEGVSIAFVGAFGALALTLVIRAGFLAPLLLWLRRRNRRSAHIRDQFTAARDSIRTARPDATLADFIPDDMRRGRMAKRFRRFFADTNYYLNQPLGKGAGVVLVWAGMRGAITVAAAQTLPDHTPHRSLLILIAFIAATASLLIQGVSLRQVISRFAPQRDLAALEAQGATLSERLQRAADAVDPDLPLDQIAQERMNLQYRELRHARSEGIYDSEALHDALSRVDAEQLYRRTLND